MGGGGRICVNLNKNTAKRTFVQNSKYFRIYLGLLHNICIQNLKQAATRATSKCWQWLLRYQVVAALHLLLAYLSVNTDYSSGCYALAFSACGAPLPPWLSPQFAQPITVFWIRTRPNKRKIFTWVSFTLCQLNRIIKLFCVIWRFLNIGK